MTEYLDVLKLVARRLGTAGLPYMVSGSTAMGYYAQPRMTRDIDIVIGVDRSEADTLAGLFGDDFYCDVEAIRKAVAERRMANVIHLPSLVKIDLIVRKDEPYRRTEFERRLRHDIEDTEVWMVAPEDLVLSKLIWAKAGGSELQLRDVRNLVTSVDSLDWRYLEEWADRLSVAQLLREARS